MSTYSSEHNETYILVDKNKLNVSIDKIDGAQQVHRRFLGNDLLSDYPTSQGSSQMVVEEKEESLLYKWLWVQVYILQGTKYV